jgi:hypothetical protein
MGNSKILGLIICLLMGCLGWFARAQSERLLKAENTGTSFVPSPVALKMLSLGYDRLLADYYWLEFVQYVGDTVPRERDNYPEASRYIDLIITLDPQLVKTYYFAAFIIGKEQNRPNEAADFIERGMRANQDNWYLPFLAGVNQYLYAHDEDEASRYYRLASTYPHAPKWLAQQADILKAKIPSYIKEINIWDSLYRSAKDSESKEKARVKLYSLWQAVYKSAPTAKIQKRAFEQLNKLQQTE